MKQTCLVLVAVTFGIQTVFGQLPETRVELQQKDVPILTDGSDQVVSRFTVTTKTARTLTQVVLSHDGTSDLDNLMSLFAPRSATMNRPAVSFLSCVPFRELRFVFGDINFVDEHAANAFDGLDRRDVVRVARDEHLRVFE